MKSLFKSVLLITFFSVLTRVAGFIFRIYLSRTIGAEALGIYQVAFSVFIVLLTIVSSGLPFVVSRMSAKYDKNKDKKIKGSLISSSLIVALILSVLLCLFILSFKNIFANLFTDRNCIEILIALLPAIVFSSVYSIFRGAMWGDNNYFALCITELYEQIFRIFVCVLLIGETMSIIDKAMTVAWSLSIACLFSALFVVLLYFYYGGTLSKPSKIYKKVLKESSPITGVRIGGSLIQPLIALIIPMRLITAGYTQAQALSLYGVAVGMTFPLLFIPGMVLGSLSTVLMPNISSALAKGDNKYIENKVENSIKITLFISMFFIPIFVGCGEQIGQLFYNNTLSGTLLQLSAWVMLPMGLNNMTSSLLNSLGMEIKSCINYFFGAIPLFLSLWFLPSVMGINAFAVGMGLSTIVTTILNIYMLRKKVHIKIKLTKNLFILSLVCLPTIAITSFLSSLLSYILPNFFVIMIACIVSGIAFVLLSMVFNIIDINFIKKFLNNLKIKREKRV